MTLPGDYIQIPQNIQATPSYGDDPWWSQKNMGLLSGKLTFGSLQASFHYQNNGPFHGGDPCSISNFNMASHLIKSTISVAKSRSCWLDVHRLLLLKYLIAQVNIFFLMKVVKLDLQKDQNFCI